MLSFQINLYFKNNEFIEGIYSSPCLGRFNLFFQFDLIDLDIERLSKKIHEQGATMVMVGVLFDGICDLRKIGSQKLWEFGGKAR